VAERNLRHGPATGRDWGGAVGAQGAPTAEPDTTRLSDQAGKLAQPHAGHLTGARLLLSRRYRDRLSPKEASLAMRQYEMMIILDPALEEKTVQPSLEQFLRVVTSAGGTVDKVDVWGRRRLAYEIDHKSEGIYTVIELNAEPDTVKELDRQLNLNEAVLRTKVVRPDAH
jgi:small subunit ribosomal protein S6